LFGSRALPDSADQTTLIGGMLGKQVVIDLVVVALLCVFAGRLRDSRPTAIASSAALAGLVVSAAAELANWNWYGYAAGWTVVNIVDATIGFFVTGLAVGWLARRMSRGETPGVAVPAGSGYSGARSQAGVR
jgi:EamA domain-containing membrane protein RarD